MAIAVNLDASLRCRMTLTELATVRHHDVNFHPEERKRARSASRPSRPLCAFPSRRHLELARAVSASRPRRPRKRGGSMTSVMGIAYPGGNPFPSVGAIAVTVAGMSLHARAETVFFASMLSGLTAAVLSRRAEPGSPLNAFCGYSSLPPGWTARRLTARRPFRSSRHRRVGWPGKAWGGFTEAPACSSGRVFSPPLPLSGLATQCDPGNRFRPPGSPVTVANVASPSSSRPAPSPRPS